METEYCAMLLYPATLEMPQEYCENEVMLGSSYCYQHDHEIAGCCSEEEYDPFKDEENWEEGK